MTSVVPPLLLACLCLFAAAPAVLAAAPAITFTPASGPVSTLITVTGTALSSGYSATINGNTAIMSVLTTTQVTLTVQPGTAPGGIITIYDFSGNILGQSATPFCVTGTDVPIITPNPSLSVCSNSSATFELAHDPADTTSIYSWVLSPGATITSGANTYRITVNPGNASSVTATGTITNSCGSATNNKTVRTRPYTDIYDNSPSVVCPGSTNNTAAVTNDASTTYTWSISNGTLTGPNATGGGTGATGYQVQFTAPSGGDAILTVTAAQSGGACGSITNTNSFHVSTSPATIIAPSSACPSTTFTASAPSLSGASYSWSISGANATFSGGATTATGGSVQVNVPPAATGQITLNLTVTACGGSTYPAIVYIPILGDTSGISISADSTVCANSSGNYASLSTYTPTAVWTITNGTFSGGATTATGSSVSYQAGPSGIVGLTATIAGCPGTVATKSVTVAPDPSATTMTGADSVCVNSTGNTASVPPGAAGYSWTIANGTITSDAYGNAITYTAGARGTAVILDVEVYVGSCSARAHKEVALAPLVGITGPSAACPGSTVTLSVPTESGATYSWNILNASAVTSPTNAASVTFTMPSVPNVLATVTKTGGSCPSAQNTSSFTVSPNPANLAVPATYCGYSYFDAVAPAWAGATYAWTITNGSIVGPSNGSRVTVAPYGSGNITVALALSNVTGLTCGTSFNASATIVPGPDTSAAAITAPGFVCAGQPGTASATLYTGVTYSWSITNGTITTQDNNQVWFTAGSAGNVGLSVDISGCTPRHLFKEVPLNANTTITVSSRVCAGSAANTASVPSGALSYAWSIQNGTITSATNGNAITFTAGTGIGTTLDVDVTGSCGSGHGSTSFHLTPDVYWETAGPMSVCPGSSVYIATTSTGSTYQWTVSAGSITSGANSYAMWFIAPASGDVTATITKTDSACPGVTNSASAKFTTDMAKINAPSTFCGTSPFYVDAPFYGGATYTWTATNATLTSGVPPLPWTQTVTPTGAGDVTVSVQITGVTGLSCGSTFNSTRTITKSADVTTAAISAEAFVCQGTSGHSASVTSFAGATYNWSIMNGSITSSTTGSTITYTAGSGNGAVNLSVAISSGCSMYTARKDVPLNADTTMTATPAAACVSSAGNKVSVPAGGSSYNWMIQNGTITAGQGTREITYTAGPNGGFVSFDVDIVGSCGNAHGHTGFALKPYVDISAPAAVCPSRTGVTAYVTPEAGATYSWTIQKGTLTTNASGSSITFDAPASGDVLLTVSSTGGACGIATNSAQFTVSTNPAHITAQATFCGTNPIQLFAPMYPGAVYTWTATNGSITGPGGNQTQVTPDGSGLDIVVHLDVSGVNGLSCGTSFSDAKTIAKIADATGTSINAPDAWVCAGSVHSASVTPISGATYVWTVQNGSVVGSNTGSSITYTAGSSGSVGLTVTINACTPYTTSTTVPINANATITATPPNVCNNSAGGTSYSASVPYFAGVTYAWAIGNGTILSGQNTSTITYKAGSGPYVSLDVTVTTNCGTGVTRHLGVPIQPYTNISAPSAACPSSTGNVASVTYEPGTTYNWTINAGTTSTTATGPSITFNAPASGDVTLNVTAIGGSCSGTNSSVFTVHTDPAYITGPSAFCAGGTVPPTFFSAPLYSGATYAWTVTGGTPVGPTNGSSVTVQADGSADVVVQVHIGNVTGLTCGTDFTGTKTMARIGNPAGAVITTTDTFVCGSSAGHTASVTPVSGASYSWTIQNGSITSGTTGTSVTYTAGTSGSINLSVTIDACGPTVLSKSIPINADTTVTAPTSVCINSPNNVASVPAGAGSYQWTIRNGTITAGATTNTVMFTAGPSGGFVTLDVDVVNSACTGSAHGHSEVLLQPDVNIGGPSGVCPGDVVVLGVVPETGATYAWTISAGTLTSANNGNQITFNAPATTNTDVVATVTRTSPSCPGTNTSTFTVSTNPAHVTAPPTYCGTPSFTAFAPVYSGASYAWTISGGTITSGAGTHSITISPSNTADVVLGVTITGVTGLSCTGPYTDSRTVVKQGSAMLATVTASSYVCSKSAGNTASATDVVGATYSWTITNGTITGGEGTRSITYTAGTSGYVNLSVSIGACSGITTGVSVPINAQTKITAPTSICINSSGTAASVAAGASSYSWSIINGTITSGQGTNAITFSNGTASWVYLTVTATTSCGSATNSMFPIPTRPYTNVSAPMTVCPNSTGNVASVTSESGATYNWSITNGTITSATNTNQITFTAPPTGNTFLTVATTGGSCGGSNTFTWKTATDPSAITAPDSVCANASFNASATPIQGATYSWFVNGGSIIGPSNMWSINVQAGPTGPVIATVTVTNAGLSCGSTFTSTKTIAIGGSTTGVQMTAPPGTCPSSNGNMASVTPVTGATYTWSITNGTITAGQSTPSITFTAGATGSVHLAATVAACGTTTVSADVAIATAVPISVNPFVCVNSIDNPASAPVIAGATYLWTITGGTITSGTTAPVITFTAPATGQVTLSVTISMATTGCSIPGTTTIPVFACGPAPLALTNVWMPVGPDGAEFQAIAAAPSDPNVIYASGYSGGGMWRTKDGGANWSRSAAANLAGPASLAVSPFDPNVAVGISSSTVHRTTDGGTTWTTATGPSGTVAFSVTTPGTVYVAKGDGFYTSTDNGVTFTKTSAPSGIAGDWALRIVPQPAAIWVAYRAAGVLRSTDGGVTWIGSNNGLPASGSPASFNVTDFAIDPSTPSQMYLVANYGQDLWASTDTGGTWTKTSTLPGMRSINVQPGNHAVFVVDDLQDGRTTLIRSNDRGVTFTDATPGHLSASAVLFDSANPSNFWAAMDLGLYRTADGGVSWREAHRGMRAVEASKAVFAGPNKWWGNLRRGILRTPDGGKTLTVMNPLPGYPVGEAIAVNPSNPIHIVTTALPAGAWYCYPCKTSALIRSTDGGTTWSAAPNPDYSSNLASLFQIWALEFDTVAPNTLWVGAVGSGTQPIDSPNRIYKSTDGGATLVAASNGIPRGGVVEAFAISHQPAGTVVFAAVNRMYTIPGDPLPGVYRSTDAGASWSRLSSGLPTDYNGSSYVAAVPSTQATLYATISSTAAPGLYKSTDGGNTWSIVNGLPTGVPWTIAIDPMAESTMYVGYSSMGVYRTTDGGATWKPFSTGLGSEWAMSINIDPANHNHLIAGSRGGFWEINIDDSDTDADGVSPATENAGPNGGDGNGDGIPDSLQANVTSLPAVSGPYVTIASEAGTTLVAVRSMTNPSPADAPANVVWPVAHLSFTVTGVTPGGSAMVTLYLPSNTAIYDYFRHGPTPDNLTPHWYSFMYDGTTGAEIFHETGRTRIVLHFVDGKRGDDDLIPNGVIVDPGGPAAAATAPCSPATITAATPTSFCAGGSVTLSATPSGGTAPYTWRWYNGTTLISGATNSTYVATASGTYSAEFTDNAGCSASKSNAITVVVNPTPSVSVAAPATAFCAGGGVTLTATPSGGSGSFTSYQWYSGTSPIGGANAASYTATASGTYAVTVTDSVGCTSARSNAVTVTANTAPSATIAVPAATSFCAGTSLTLNATASGGSGTFSSYQWYNGTSPISGANAASYSATASGTYSVTVTDSAGCTSPRSNAVTLTANPAPSVAIAVPASTSFCTGTNLTLTATASGGSGGFTAFQWYSGSTAIAGATLSTYTATAAGTYSVTVTDSAGCISPKSSPITLTTTQPPVATITTGSVCPGGSGSASVSTTPGATYTWSISGGTITAGQATSGITFTAATTGGVTVSVTVTSGSCTASGRANVPVTSAGTLAVSGPRTACPNVPFLLDAGGTYDTYKWSTGATTRTITVTQTASSVTYSVIASSAGGCAAQGSITVALGTAPDATITASASTLTVGDNGSASVAAMTGAAYDWSASTGVTISGSATGNSIAFKAASAGTAVLRVTVTSADGCTASGAKNITVNAPVCGTTPVTLDTPAAGATGLTSPVTISWLPVTDATLYRLRVYKSGVLQLSSDTVSNSVSATLADGTYSWSVAVERGTACQVVPSETRTFTVASTPVCGTTPATLISPANGAKDVKSPVGFSWSAVADATATTVYIIRVQDSAGTVHVSTTSSTAASFTLPSGSTSWSVGVQRSADCAEVQSASWTFTVAAGDTCAANPAPGAVSPGNNAKVDSPVTFAWSEAAGAIGYRVYISANGNPAQDVGTTDASGRSLKATVPSGAVSWYVEALFNGCPSVVSNKVSFTVNAADPCAGHYAADLAYPPPDYVSSTSTINFRWQAVEAASGYRLWVSVDGHAFAPIASTSKDVTTKEANIATGKNEWYVETLFDGCTSLESSHRKFDVPAKTVCPTDQPVPSAPSGTTQNSSATFTWSGVGANSYELWMGLDGGAAALAGTTTGTALTKTLSAGTTTWFVVAKFDGCADIASSSRSVTYTPPVSCPPQDLVQSSPINGMPATTGQSVSFSWSALSGATGYSVAFGDGAVASVTTNGASHTYANAGTYNWRVTALFTGCDSITSASSSVVVSAPPPPCTTPPAPSLIAPSQVTSGVTYTVRWTAPAPDLNYTLQEWTTADGSGAITISTTADSIDRSHTNSGSAPVTYRYRVRATALCAGATPGPYSGTMAVAILPPTPSGSQLTSSVPVDNTQVLTYTIPIDASQEGLLFTATPNQPWLTVTPSSGTVPPGGMVLTVTADARALSIGTSLGSVTITYSSPSTASKVGRTGNTGSSTTTISVNVVQPVVLQPKNTPPPDALIIPGVAHAAGIGSQFQSDVRLSNTSAQAMRYQLTFTPMGEGGLGSGKQTTIDVSPGKTIALDDVLASWFGGSLGAMGTLEIRPLTQTNSSTLTSTAQNLMSFASSRTYAVTDAGTFGQYVPAIPFASFIGGASDPSKATILSLQQIAQSDAFRTNLGFVEGAGQPAQLLVSIFGDDGTKLKDLNVNLAAGQHYQMNSFLSDQGLKLSDGRVEVKVLSSTGRVTAYASVLDNKTNDPLLVTPVQLGGAGASRWVIPGVADLNNGFTNWITDVRIFNAGSTPVDATLTFYSQSGGEPRTQQITLGSHEVKAFDSILANTFGAPNDGGALHITTTSDAQLFATARTYNKATTGTYGQFLSGITPADAIAAGSRPLQILQVEESDRYRTNVALAEVTGKPVKVQVAVVLPDSRVTPTVEVALAPNEYRQLNSLLRSMGITSSYNARVTVKVIEGAGRITACAAVIDQKTQDPTFIPAQ